MGITQIGNSQSDFIKENIGLSFYLFTTGCPKINVHLVRFWDFGHGRSHYQTICDKTQKCDPVELFPIVINFSKFFLTLDFLAQKHYGKVWLTPKRIFFISREYIGSKTAKKPKMVKKGINRYLETVDVPNFGFLRHITLWSSFRLNVPI